MENNINCETCISNDYCDFKNDEQCEFYIKKTLPNRLCCLCQNLINHTQFYVDCKEFGRGFNKQIEKCVKFKLKV